MSHFFFKYVWSTLHGTGGSSGLSSRKFHISHISLWPRLEPIKTVCIIHRLYSSTLVADTSYVTLAMLTQALV